MATISEKKAIIELYVGWFNRVPDVEGINFWIDQFDAGSTLAQISNEFYQTAIHQFSEDTGYSAGMSDDAFITQLYDGVMGRAPGSALAPDATEIGYWANKLNGEFAGDKGAMVVQMIEEIKAFDATGNDAIKEVQDKFNNKVQVAEVLALTGNPLWDGTTIQEGKDALVGVTHEDSTVADAISKALNATNEGINTTSGADELTGTASNDTFLATQDTLGLGDKLDGQDGNDTLDISISGAGVTLTGFETKNIENIEVKSLSTNESTLDLSDVKGATDIESYETDGAALTIRDIQETTAEISIVDTDEDHNINYDVQTLSGDADTITLNVKEIRPATGDAEVDIDFTQDTTRADADIETLVVNSSTRNDTPPNNNNIKSISVGDALTTMDINGDADLKIVDALDRNLATVDASDLNAELMLDMSNANPDVAEINFTGAQQATTITFGDATNTKVITTHGGNDTITANAGNNNVTSAAGDDTVTLGAGNDTVSAGEGNDTLTDAGGNNDVDMGAGNDTASFSGEGNDIIKGGAGNDTITSAAGHDDIDGGEGDDSIIMTPGDLEVLDTVVGGEGRDTVIITDADNITESEAQRVTEVEVFQLDGGSDTEFTTLTVTDNLIKTATDNDFTVDTSDATGGHTVDMTNITAPEYKFTLTGSEDHAETVIADDATINSMSTLTFGANAGDTLRVVDGATITVSDLANTTGLDVMVLESDSNIAQTWNIDLDKSMTIDVSTNVPEGSVLNINTVGDAVVTVNFNANITVNPTGNVTLNTQFNFTDNADDMTGTAGDDVFVANSRDQVETADFANASTEVNGDELILNFGVFNGDESLDEQLNKADISEMEIITFKQDLTSASGVRFTDVDGTTGEMEVDLNVINLTDLNDTVIVDDANGVTVNGFGGADNLTTNSAATLDGGDDADTLNGSADSDVLNGGNGGDTINGNGGDDTVDGGAGDDTITTAAGNDSITAGEGNDTVDASSGNDAVSLGEGDDHLTIAADDLSSADVIDGGEGSDTLYTSDTNMADADFTEVSNMEVLTLNAATTGNFGEQFNDSGIATVNGSADVDSINFQNVTNDKHLTIHGNDGDDIIKGGSGNDIITAGEGADFITGSTGEDKIDLAETVAVVDQVVYDRAEDGAQTGQNVGHDTITNFVVGQDLITIDGSLESALDNNAGGDFNADAVTFTNEAALDADAAGLAVYTNTTLQDSDLTQENFTEVLDLLNTNLQTSNTGDNVLYVVQSTNNSAVYFYQENGGNDIIDLNEIKMLALVDNADNESLLTAADISDNDVPVAGTAGAVVVDPVDPADIDINANDPATGTAEADNFTFAPTSAALDGVFNVVDFDTANDQITIDLPDVPAGIDSLDDLLGVANGTLGNINVAADPFANKLIATFGADADGNLIALEIAGITNAEDVAVVIV
jgi:Ca2+-binding RTX toxin-like protein